MDRTESMMEKRLLFFTNSSFLRLVLVILILILGLGARLIDLGDPPLDFAATRQLRSLIMARGYYEAMDVPSTREIPPEDRQFAIQVGQSEAVIEPPIMEHLAAYTYALLGREDFRIPRLYSIFFWVLGGIPLYLLAKKLLGDTASMATLAFYEFVPYGIISSRAFQPDPLMICLILFSWFFQFHWFDKKTWGSALLAGVFTGLAVLVKTTAVFFVGVPFIWLVFSSGFGKALRNGMVYLMAALSLLPGGLFMLWNVTSGGNAGAIFGSRFFTSLYFQPHWYQSWFMTAKSLVGYFPLFLGVLAIFFFPGKKARIWYICLWLAYLLLGFVFSYHISTHDYYSMPLIPIVSIGFGLAFSTIFEHIQNAELGWVAKVAVLAILAFASALSLLKARADLLASDYRYEITYWNDMGKKIGRNSRVVALTHDYGYRLIYWGYIHPTLWETWGDLYVASLSGQEQAPFAQEFEEKTRGYNYFLVTLINDFNSQTQLHDTLYARYPYETGEGYILFDLQHPN